MNLIIHLITMMRMMIKLMMKIRLKHTFIYIEREMKILHELSLYWKLEIKLISDFFG